MFRILSRHSRIHHREDHDEADLGPFFIGTPQNLEKPQAVARHIDEGGKTAAKSPSASHFTRADRRQALKSRLIVVAKCAAAGFIGLLSLVFLLIMLLRWVPAPTSAFMLRHKLHGRATAYRWVDGDRISPNMAIAVVAAEDQRFPHHFGFDFEAILDAVAENRRRSTPRGASTISQQVAKNLFLWPGRSFMRKGLEAGLTVAIEICWPKKRILEVYLNIAQFGPKTFGVAAAGQRYFHKTPDRLTPYEAALLAAVLPNPENYTVAPPSPYVRQRAEDIREQVRLLGGPSYLSDMD